MKPRRSTPRATVSTRALVLGRVPHRESDWVIDLFTEARGRVGAIARGARQSRKRFGGTLEPFHTLRVCFDAADGSKLAVLSEALIETPRPRLISNWERMQSGGRGLSWIRRALPPHSPDGRTWELALSLLDRLDSESGEREQQIILAEIGLELLEALGWGLEFERCVVCSRACGKGQAAWVDPERGGLLCRRCGGGQLLLSAERRQLLARSANGERRALGPEDAEIALSLVETALRVHAGLD